MLRGAQGGAQGEGEILAAWRLESEGWSKIDVVLDSGAADSVGPRSMAPQFKIEDTEASKGGVYYTSATGGKINNVGQQHTPVALRTESRRLRPSGSQTPAAP